AGHILLSSRAADDLAQYAEWKSQLHYLGEVEVKHGVRVGVASLYGDGTGNAALPTKLRRQELVRKRRLLVATTGALIILLSAGIGTWAWQHHLGVLRRAMTEAAAQREKSDAVLPCES